MSTLLDDYTSGKTKGCFSLMANNPVKDIMDEKKSQADIFTELESLGKEYDRIVDLFTKKVNELFDAPNIFSVDYDNLSKMLQKHLDKNDLFVSMLDEYSGYADDLYSMGKNIKELREKYNQVSNERVLE